MEALAHAPIDAYLTPPLLATPETPLTHITGLLRAHGAYEVFVPEGRRVGMVTVRSLLSAGALGHARARSVAQYVPALTRASRVREAVRLLTEYRLRALPVVETGRVVGQLPIAALVQAVVATATGRVAVSRVMTRQPATVGPDDPVARGRDLMVRRRFDHLPVRTAARMWGVVTSSHLLFAVLAPPDPDRLRMSVPGRRWAQPVRGVMDPAPLEVEVATPGAELAGGGGGVGFGGGV